MHFIGILVTYFQCPYHSLLFQTKAIIGAFVNVGQDAVVKKKIMGALVIYPYLVAGTFNQI